MKRTLRLWMVAVLALAALALAAQNRKVTPVETDDEAPEKPLWHFYDKHGNPLKEPVLVLLETDTTQQASSKPVYPLYNGVNLGLNFFDAIAKLAGQNHCSFDLWASVSLHNWFFPVLEAGVGFGKQMPEEGDTRPWLCKVKPSPYLKLGLNYNILYKSNSAYQPFVGLRAGWSTLRYDLPEAYGLSNTTFYGEIVAGIQVMLWRQISMGWTGRLHFKMHETDNGQAAPWFVPGYGTSALSLTLSLIYTIK